MKSVVVDPASFKRFPTSCGNVYSGMAPDTEILKIIEDHDIVCIWNLAAELEYMLPEQRQYADHVIHGNIVDFALPVNKNHYLSQLNFICNLLKNGNSVFIHCMAGRDRTGMTLACIKRILEGSSAKDAIRAAQLHCTGPKVDIHKDYVEDLFLEES